MLNRSAVARFYLSSSPVYKFQIFPETDGQSVAIVFAFELVITTENRAAYTPSDTTVDTGYNETNLFAMNGGHCQANIASERNYFAIPILLNIG